MAHIEMGKGEKGKKSKLQKKHLRVDFTPMVDMNMLLITFFMFCTTLSMPQVMDIAMPTNKAVPKEDISNVPESRTITAILGEDNKVYYYHGKANYTDYTSLKVTDTKGFREVLLAKNHHVVEEVKQLRKLYNQRQLSEEQLKELITKAKKSDKSAFILIKPTNVSRYENLINVLDEMQICDINKYTVVDVTEGDQFLIDNYNSKGKLALY